MTLDPTQRTHLVDQLLPGTGWRLSGLVGTTYGMDLETLLALLLGLAGGDRPMDSRGGGMSVLHILQSLIGLAERIQVAADQTNIRPFPEVDPRLFGLMDSIIHDVQLEEEAHQRGVAVNDIGEDKNEGRKLCITQLHRATEAKTKQRITLLEGREAQLRNTQLQPRTTRLHRKEAHLRIT